MKLFNMFKPTHKTNHVAGNYGFGLRFGPNSRKGPLSPRQPQVPHAHRRLNNRMTISDLRSMVNKGAKRKSIVNRSIANRSLFNRSMNNRRSIANRSMNNRTSIPKRTITQRRSIANRSMSKRRSIANRSMAQRRTMKPRRKGLYL
jgi:hypothetical protein